jgi:hypothetical protein
MALAAAACLQAFDLACIDDDAHVVLEAELDLRRVEDDLWQQIGPEALTIRTCSPPICGR